MIHLLYLFSLKNHSLQILYYFKEFRHKWSNDKLEGENNVRKFGFLYVEQFQVTFKTHTIQISRFAKNLNNAI